MIQRHYVINQSKNDMFNQDASDHYLTLTSYVLKFGRNYSIFFVIIVKNKRIWDKRCFWSLCIRQQKLLSWTKIAHFQYLNKGLVLISGAIQRNTCNYEYFNIYSYKFAIEYVNPEKVMNMFLKLTCLILISAQRVFQIVKISK